MKSSGRMYELDEFRRGNFKLSAVQTEKLVLVQMDFDKKHEVQFSKEKNFFFQPNLSRKYLKKVTNS